MQRRCTRLLTASAAAVALTASIAGTAGAETTVTPYTEGRSGYEAVPLFSVDDRVPLTSNPLKDYRMVGIPDGLGAHGVDGGAAVYMNHEFGATVQSQPVVGGATIRGAYVSRWILDGQGDPVSGDLAYDEVYQANKLVGPVPTTDNLVPAFARLCSGSLAGPDVGFDRNIYLAQEETEAVSGSFDGKGGQTVAIAEGEAHALPKMGHFSKENNLVWPNEGRRTLVFSLEDGPSTPDSQLYMYVGVKDPEATNWVNQNGLNNGKLYVFVATDPAIDEEGDFQAGSVWGRWVRVPKAAKLNDVALEGISDSLGALGFVRIEDGAFAKTNRNDFYFVTTGGNLAEGNELGRAYHLRLNQDDPTGPARLDVVYNADTIVAGGGDVALSPDNIDTSRTSLMIQEDGTTQSRAVMATKGRDGQIWRFDLDQGILHTTVDADSATPVAELSPPGRDGVAVGPGVWETSGIINASEWYGDDSWLFDVQAHVPTTAPAAGTVEDGQLLLLRPAGEET